MFSAITGSGTSGSASLVVLPRDVVVTGASVESVESVEQAVTRADVKAIGTSNTKPRRLMSRVCHGCEPSIRSRRRSSAQSLKRRSRSRSKCRLIRRAGGDGCHQQAASRTEDVIALARAAR